MQARLPQLPCSHLQIAVRDDLTPVLRGRVGSAEELADLRGALDGLAALGKPELAVEILEPPFCQALDQLEVAMAGEMTPPAIGLNSPNLTFQDGDFVVVTIEVPADFGDGYLHVIFIDHADKVIHLLPNPFVRNTVVHGGERVQLGVDGKSRRAGLRDYQVTPPYGRGLVLALLSTVPLHEVGVREVETSADLMASLRAAAAGLQPASLRVAHIVLTTVAARR